MLLLYFVDKIVNIIDFPNTVFVFFISSGCNINVCFYNHNENKIYCILSEEGRVKVIYDYVISI